jgi:alkylated DNA repair dioxygenase AlkB
MAERTLFDEPAVELAQSVGEIEDLLYQCDFVTREVEDCLLQEIDVSEWRTDLRRRVQHYGYRYDYRSRSVDYTMRIGELPAWASTIALRLVTEGIFPEKPDQVIVNEYEPGQGISNHIDCEPCFTGVVASLSLGSPCVMNFTHMETKRVVPLLLEQRSLVVLRGKSRYGWMHGILPRKNDQIEGVTVRRSRRVSLTFRKVILREQD